MVSSILHGIPPFHLTHHHVALLQTSLVNMGRSDKLELDQGRTHAALHTLCMRTFTTQKMPVTI